MDELSPEESLAEILFGLIMVLTFTLGASLAASRDGQAIRALVYGAIGCNIAWGLIDAVFYVMNRIFVRGRRARLIEAFAASADEQAAIAAIRKELDPQLEPVTREQDRDRLYRSMFHLLRHARHAPNAISRSDLRGACAVFLLVSLTAVPAGAPFLFIGDAWWALRVSNALLIALMFFVGFRWARHTKVNPWLAGFGLTTIGVILVAVAIALGG